MVSYQKLTQIGFDVVKSKGAQFDGQRPQNAQTVVQIIAEEWAENKNEYRQMTEQQARAELQDVLVVN